MQAFANPANCGQAKKTVNCCSTRMPCRLEQSLDGRNHMTWQGTRHVLKVVSMSRLGRHMSRCEWYVQDRDKDTRAGDP